MPDVCWGAHDETSGKAQSPRGFILREDTCQLLRAAYGNVPVLIVNQGIVWKIHLPSSRRANIGLTGLYVRS